MPAKGTSPSAGPKCQPRQRRNLGEVSETRQSEQGALKRGGIDLLVMPPKLKGRLPPGGFVASSRYAVW